MKTSCMFKKLSGIAIFAIGLCFVGWCKPTPEQVAARTDLLFRAVYNNDVELAKSCIESGANINAISFTWSNRGVTPLIFAIQEEREKMVDLLIKFKADVNKKSSKPEWTPVMWAVMARKFNSNTLDMLAKAKADLNMQCEGGDTPLTVAAKSGWDYVVEKLIKAGADVNAKDKNGNTPLSLALRLTPSDNFDRRVFGNTVALLRAAGANEGPQSAQKLTVWSFTDELRTMIDKYYKVDRPDVEIEYSLSPTDQFPNKLDPVLASGNGAPDVFALEDAFVRKYVEQGDKFLLDLTDVYNEVKNKMIPYPIEVATYNGKVYAMSWQVCPGALFYRRSLAKKYLGTDDPAIIQNYFKNWNAFLETARNLKRASREKCVAISATGDLFKPFQDSRKAPWIQNGKLVIDSAMEDYMEMVKILKDEVLEGGQRQWSEGWFAGFKGELKDEYGRSLEVFGTFQPTWGLRYVLKHNAGNTAGDWAMIEGPTPYRWGGTWVAAYKETKVPKLAKDFIKYITIDDGFLTRWAKDTGDVVSSNNVNNAIKDTYSEPFLNGQNHYAEFTKIANHVNGKLNQGTDQIIEEFWNEAAGAYASGEKSKTEAIAEFKRQVYNKLGY